MSRAKSRRNLAFQDVLDALQNQGIAIRVASPKLVMEEVSIVKVSFCFVFFLVSISVFNIKRKGIR